MRRIEHLLTGRPWCFAPDPHREGERLGFHRRDFDDDRWPTITPPACFEAGRPELAFYAGACWHRLQFPTPEGLLDGRHVVLRFEGVNLRARVWLNDALLGEHRDAFLPFEFDVDDHLHAVGDNLLVVEADNAGHPEDVPGPHTGWRIFGGILREAGLYATPASHIRSVRIDARPRITGPDAAPDEPVAGDVSLRVTALGPGSRPTPAQVSVTITDVAGGQVARLGPESLTLEPGDDATVTLTGQLATITPWSPGSPACYDAAIELVVEGQAEPDRLTERFGFRAIEANPDGLRLNGRPIFLQGFNRHEDSPRTDMAVDHTLTRSDLQAMKQAGANFIRLCHYPHHPAELDLCDELGLLAMGEIPLYFWNDEAEGLARQAERGAVAERQLRSMIERDANHPSLIFWSVSNETQESDPAVIETNRSLIRLAKSLDPTRLCVHVSNHWISHPHFEEDDVICVNHYPSMDFSMRASDQGPAKDRSRATETWRRNLAEVRRLHPDKPVMVAEFGYCSFPGTFDHAMGEDEHARVLEAEFAAFDQPWLCGALVWCWADHAWPAGRFLGGLSVSPFGVVSRDRRELAPFHAIQRLFQSKAPSHTPVA